MDMPTRIFAPALPLAFAVLFHDSSHPDGGPSHDSFVIRGFNALYLVIVDTKLCRFVGRDVQLQYSSI
jgi:hypothetical protein